MANPKSEEYEPAPQASAEPEKTTPLFQHPLFYLGIAAVGIAGFYITRESQRIIKRNRLRAARRFKGNPNGQKEQYWDEEDLGFC